MVQFFGVGLKYLGKKLFFLITKKLGFQAQYQYVNLFKIFMDILGLVDGVVDFAMQACSGRAQLQ